MPYPLRIDAATPADVPLILDFIRQLAAYENQPDAAVATEALLQRALFSEAPAAEAVVARWDGAPAAFALWFQTFSTWTGLPGMWLEDLFVHPGYRRRGIGKSLLVYLASICRDRGYGRFEWAVLDWNEPALDFYQTLDAVPLNEWTMHRLSGESILRLAERVDSWQ
jgi:GNAT superfamily N-acetyltransferase